MRELRFERNDEKMTRGAVAAVLAPNLPDSGGSQFFIAITNQPALDGQYTIFARVAEGLNVAQKISQADADATIPKERIVIRKVAIREKPAPAPEPFVTETVEELSHYRAVLETSLGTITFSSCRTRRRTPCATSCGSPRSVCDGTAFHRVVRGFVIGAGSCRRGVGARHHADATSARCSRSSTRRTTRGLSRWRTATIRQRRHLFLHCHGADDGAGQKYGTWPRRQEWAWWKLRPCR
jgi:cyclophilin family peptidyl-prolyl cis-trans isomerase